MIKRTLNRVASTGLFASLSVISPLVCAQTAAPIPAPVPEEIVVTGSRIIRNGNDSPTPVTVISPEALTTTHPTNVAEALNDLPVFAGSRTQASNTGTSGAAGAPATSTNALNVINLRNMGLSRTLILNDGNRAPPSTPEGFVDIDTIPQMLLKRVDVVTGGASAVYGSDAITGVVNFITDTKFTGLKANIQTGISKYSDDRTFEIGVAGGSNVFEGRGHVLGSASYRTDGGIDSKFKRPWGTELRTLQGDGSAAFPYFQVIGARVNNLTFGGRINNGALIDQQFTTGGLLTPFIHGSKTGQGGTIPAGLPYEIGGDGAYFDGQIRSTLDLKQLYGRFDYDVNDHFRFFASLAGTENHSIGTGNYFSQAALTISRDNAFLPAATVAALGTAVSFNLGKIFTALPRGALETTARQVLPKIGFSGDFGGGWNWEAAYTQGNGNFKVSQNSAINQGRLYAALDSVLVNGTAVCRAAATNSAYAGCIPLNPFGVKSESQAAVDYVVSRVGWTTKLKSSDFSASVTGSPFSTWAAPVNVAISGEWRSNSEEVDSNSLPANSLVPSTLVNCTGILRGCNATQSVYNATVGILPKASATVKELALEADIPLLRNVSGFQALDLSLAYRLARYDRAGDAKTWKTGLTWDPFDMLTLRATASRDFRAPTLDELFRPQALSFTGFTDTISGTGVQLNQTPTYNGGNPSLKPEIADNLTFGAVFRPTSNFSVAVDYFDIKVKNLIFLVQGNSPPEQKICYDSKGASPYCALITRGLGIYDPSATGALTAANAITTFYQLPINIAEQDTNGVDVEANYKTSLFGKPFSIRGLTTYQPHVKFKRTGISPDNDYGGVAFGTNGTQATPVWRVSAFLDFQPVERFTISVLERWRSSLKFHSDPSIVASSPKIKSVAFTNMNLGYEFQMYGAKMQAFLNVANLFNTTPPQAGFWGNPNPGQFGEFVLGDDVIGRYYTAGFKMRF